MVTIDGDEIVSGSTIDGQEISEITMDGDVVWTAVADSIVNNLDYWWPMDEGAGTSITDILDGESASFRGGPDWVAYPDGVGGSALDMGGDSDGWVTDGTLAYSSSTFNITGWVETGSVPPRVDNIFALGTSDAESNLNVNGDACLIELVEDDTFGANLMDNGSHSRRQGAKVSVGGSEFIFFSANFDTNADQLEVYVYDENGIVGDDTGDSNGRNFGTLSGPILFSNYDNADTDGSGHDGKEIAVGVSGDKLSENDIEDIWEDTKP